MQVPVTLLKGEVSTSFMLVVDESQMLRTQTFSELSLKHVNFFLLYLTFNSVTWQYLSQQYPIHTFT